MATPRQPQDRKPKVDPGAFSFVYKGKTHVFPKPLSEVSSPGWLRANRRRDELDLTFTIIEALADDDPELLAVIDSMPLKDFNQLSARLTKAFTGLMEASPELGESSAS